jgi:hypothetical protein
MATPTGRGPRLLVFVQGKPWTLNPAIQEQLFLIGREAAMNALRHSQATKIEVEVQYLRDPTNAYFQHMSRWKRLPDGVAAQNKVFLLRDPTEGIGCV